jgi:hypothetical protein
MRRVLITLAIFVLLGLALLPPWIFYGREVSLFLDRFGTIESTSTAVNSIAYEGSGSGGILIINGLDLSLNSVTANLSTSIGSTKDDQLALASGGKVFPFGQLAAANENRSDRLATTRPAGDEASLITRRSFLSWPNPSDFNFMTGQSPSWNRHIYYQLIWKKPSGAKLEMLWRYEQYFYPSGGWANGLMTHPGSTGLIQINISL